MEKIKDLLINAYYDIMSNPLLSVIVRVIFICLILILIAYFLFYAVISRCYNSPYILYLETSKI